MLDTAVKNGQSLFDALSMDELTQFVCQARECRLQVALAGSLRLEHLLLLRQLAPDIIGVRGVVCGSGDRNSRLDPAKVQEFLAAANGGR